MKPDLTLRDSSPESTGSALSDELSVIATAARTAGIEPPTRGSLTALCLSGGGIRSAIYCLGVVQGLAKTGFLGSFDYLSTVSGGGYIGGWLTSWIRRRGLSAVISSLAGSGTEPEPIKHLRSYSYYLTPRIGLLNVDTWTLLATFIRNMLLNWTVLIPLLAAALIIPRLLIPLYALQVSVPLILMAIAMAGILIGIAIWHEAWDLPSFGNAKKCSGTFFTRFLLPFTLGAQLLTLAWSWYVSQPALPALAETAIVMGNLKLPVWAVCIAMGSASQLLSWSVPLLALGRCRHGSLPRSRCTVTLFAAFITGGVGGALLYKAAIKLTAVATNPIAAACFALPLFMALLLAAALVHVGLVCMITGEEDREWWARASAWMLVVLLGWLGGAGLVCYGPQLLFSDISSWYNSIVAAAGTGAGILTAFYGHGENSSATAEGNDTRTQKVFATATKCAAFIFILVFLTLLALGTSWLFEGCSFPFTPADHVRVLRETSISTLLPHGLYLLLLLGIGFSMGHFADINRFSLHSMYRNRLIRAFLSASRKQSRRRPSPLTGFDAKDNLPMRQLRHRPFHVINLALNIAHHQNLAWQQRKAESFTISPLHAGSGNLGYRSVRTYGATSPGNYRRRPISLGTALAISGAAMSPNMGYHSSPLITFIMTLFNLRLGWWLGNPGHTGAETWRHYGPRFSPWVLFRELFSLTTDNDRYVYLSDGGHFENLGLYEMVFRRCQTIVVVDGGCDPQGHYEDLGNALRKIRIDLGIQINLDLEPLLNQGKRCAMGEIIYADAQHPDAPPGRLLYLKPRVRGDEPADISDYHAANKEFPHESTADQWFSESQFESYRQLGLLTLSELCPKPCTAKGLNDLFIQAQDYLNGPPRPIAAAHPHLA